LKRVFGEETLFTGSLDDGELLWSLLAELGDAASGLPEHLCHVRRARGTLHVPGEAEATREQLIDAGQVDELMRFFARAFPLVSNTSTTGSHLQAESVAIQMSDVWRGDMDVFEAFLWPLFYQSQFPCMLQLLLLLLLLLFRFFLSSSSWFGFCVFVFFLSNS
jgi:hypothetical protein